jgi:hypothetical protein
MAHKGRCFRDRRKTARRKEYQRKAWAFFRRCAVEYRWAMPGWITEQSFDSLSPRAKFAVMRYAARATNLRDYLAA